MPFVEIPKNVPYTRVVRPEFPSVKSIKPVNLKPISATAMKKKVLAFIPN